MKRLHWTVYLICVAAFADVHAGSLASGKWSPTGCGARPQVPVLNSGSVETFNNSLKEIRAWQEKTQAYNDCLVKEANADNSVIAETANTEQQRFRAEVEQISTEADEAKARLDRE